MATTIEDVRATKFARSEFSRRGIDTAAADIRAMHGVVHVRGQLARLGGVVIPDLKAETEHVCRLLKQKAEIRDVVVDCSYR